MIKQLYKLHKLLVLHCNHTALIATEIALPFWIPHKSHRWMIAPLFQHLLKLLSYQQHLPVHVRNTFSPVVSTMAPFEAALETRKSIGKTNHATLPWLAGDFEKHLSRQHMIIMIREKIQAVRVR